MNRRSMTADHMKLRKIRRRAQAGAEKRRMTSWSPDDGFTFRPWINPWTGGEPIAPARPVLQVRFGNLTRSPPTVVDTRYPDHGPLLLISGQAHMVADVVNRAVYKPYDESTAVTDLKQFPDRGHSLTIDHRWRQVADFVLGCSHERGAVLRHGSPTRDAIRLPESRRIIKENNGE